MTNGTLNAKPERTRPSEPQHWLRLFFCIAWKMTKRTPSRGYCNEHMVAPVRPMHRPGHRSAGNAWSRAAIYGSDDLRRLT